MTNQLLSLSSLSLEEALGILVQWLDDSGKRWKEIPELASWFSKANELRAEAEQIRAGSSAILEQQRSDLIQLSRQADERHDQSARALHLLLLAEQALAFSIDPPQPQRAEELERAVDMLFPDGLSILMQSYWTEAGNASRVEQLLKENIELAGMLKKLKLGNLNGLDLAKRWINEGQLLGKLEAQKTEGAKQLQDSVVTKTSVQQVRNKLIQLLHLVNQALELSTAPSSAIDALRAPLVNAATKAKKRRRNKTNGRSGESSSKGTPSEPTPETPSEPTVSEG
jgi:hypothetical protein